VFLNLFLMSSESQNLCFFFSKHDSELTVFSRDRCTDRCSSTVDKFCKAAAPTSESTALLFEHFFYLFPFSKVVWYVMIFSLCVTVLNGYFILCCDQSERIIPVLVWLVGSMIIDLSILHPLLNYTIGRYPRETHCSFCVRRRQVGQVRTPSDR